MGRQTASGKLVTATGLKSTQEALKAIDPLLSKAMDRELRGAVNQVRSKARSLAPARTGDLRRGIVTRKGSARRRGQVDWQVRSTTRQGAILELAAAGHTKRGRSLVATLNARYGSPGRFVWEAWDQTKSGVYGRIAATVRQTEDLINTRLGRG